MLSILWDTVDKVLDILILTFNVLLILDHYLLQPIKSPTAKTPCMIHPFKNLVLFTYNHKNHQKCVEEATFLFMDVSAVLQEMTVSHLLLDALLDASL